MYKLFLYCNEPYDTDDDEINKTVDKNIYIISTINIHQRHSEHWQACANKVSMQFTGPNV